MSQADLLNMEYNLESVLAFLGTTEMDRALNELVSRADHAQYSGENESSVKLVSLTYFVLDHSSDVRVQTEFDT